MDDESDLLNSHVTAEDLTRSYEVMLENQQVEIPEVEETPKQESESRPTSLTPPEQESPPPTLRIVEAMLFIGGHPLSPDRACEIMRGMTEDQFREIIDQLNQEYLRLSRPYSILSEGTGYCLC